ncbi:hypothetical protein QFZ21_000101 [Microbacterium sp. W4I20]|nr:hypothetical protein [Microbacterium sp. W4I20]
MLGNRILLMLGTATSLLLMMGGGDEPPPQVGMEGTWATNTENKVEIWRTQTSSGTEPGTSPPIGNTNPGTYTGPPRREATFDQCMDSWSFVSCYRGPDEEETPEEAEPEQATPAITITDLAQFAPAPTPLAGEPSNLGIAGMATNFVATASVTTASGTLFGLPIAVRFTPSAYDFHYGDGTDATTTSGGQSWDALGQAQFTPTATSHVYRDRGAYSADVDVRYTAEVDLGTGWIPVAGELTADGPPQEIRIFEAHTALVAYTCDQKPSSPGC